MTNTIGTFIRTLGVAALLAAAAMSLPAGAAHAADDSLSPEQRAAGCIAKDTTTGTEDHYRPGEVTTTIDANGVGHRYRCGEDGKWIPLPVGGAPTGRRVAPLAGRGVLSLR